MPEVFMQKSEIIYLEKQTANGCTFVEKRGRK